MSGRNLIDATFIQGSTMTPPVPGQTRSPVGATGDNPAPGEARHEETSAKPQFSKITDLKSSSVQATKGRRSEDLVQTKKTWQAPEPGPGLERASLGRLARPARGPRS